MTDYPQVVLFGSMLGGWREQYIIPELEKLNVTYFNPDLKRQWTPEDGKREAEYMANAETIVIVINNSTPGFTGLAELGWTALGAHERGQTFILYIMPDEVKIAVPFYLKWIPKVNRLSNMLEHYARSMRRLSEEHAKKFDIENMIVVDSMQGVIDAIHQCYSS